MEKYKPKGKQKFYLEKIIKHFDNMKETDITQLLRKKNGNFKNIKKIFI